MHESDLVEQGVEGSGLSGIEHHVCRAHEPALEDVYENCFYACRYCNDARRHEPVTAADGARLLEPCADVWGNHFVLSGDRLEPVAGDRDAAHTEYIYDLNEPRRLQMRRVRREQLSWALGCATVSSRRMLALLDAAERSGADRESLLEVAERLRAETHRTLSRYAAIPVDADEDCRCGTDAVLVLPEHLASQVQSSPLER